MDKIEANIDSALRRVATFVDIMRWVWTANFVVLIAALMIKKYVPAAIAAPTSIVSLVATAFARSAAKRLRDAKQALISEASSERYLRQAA